MNRYLATAALASILGAAIAACTETPRDTLLTELATQAQLSGEALSRVLAGSPEPLTEEQLDALARHLELDVTMVRSAAAQDPEQVRRQERDRLAGIDAIALPEHCELVERLKASGASVEVAAMLLGKAERARRDQLAAEARTRGQQARQDGLRDLQLDEGALPEISPAPRAGSEDDNEETVATRILAAAGFGRASRN